MRRLMGESRPILFIESNAAALNLANSSATQLFDWLKQFYTNIYVIDEVKGQLSLIEDSSKISDQCVNLVCTNGTLH